MKVLIIEDEERGFSRLKRLLLNMDHTLEILGPLTSIKTTIEYLQMKHDEDVIFADIGQMPLVFSGKTCIGKFTYDYVKKPYATKIFNLPLWKYGFSTATRVSDSSKASSYITKYITKDVSHILRNQHRYLASQNTDRPIERVYNVDYDELAKIYSKYLSDVSYITDVKLPLANQEILYMEFNKTSRPQETFPIPI